MKKLLSFGTCLALGLSVVGTTAALADAGKFYFDNTNTKWEAVSVWAWNNDDEMWALDNGFDGGWPGIALEVDATTGYYVYDCADVPAANFNVMFNNAGAGEQTCDAAAVADGNVGKVLVPTAKNTAEDAAANDKRAEGQWFGEWKEVGGATETPEAETPEAETPEAETPEAETPEAETPAPEAGKTADAAPIAAVAMLGLASMAVVVATRKKIA